MSDQSRPPTPFRILPWVLRKYIHAYIELPADHPAKIASRTYGLALLLSFGPTLLPFVTKVITLARTKKGAVDCGRVGNVVAGLGKSLRRELGPFGFAFAITTAVAGGSFLRNASKNLQKSAVRSQNGDADLGPTGGSLGSTLKNVKHGLWHHWTSLSDVQRTFLSNAVVSTVAIVLLQQKSTPGRPSGVPELPLTLPIDDIPKRNGISPTLDLTLILFVRALDSVVHGGLQDKLKGKGREVPPGATDTKEVALTDSGYAKNRINKWTSNLDSLVFCVCSARIIWCFFYKPNTLPKAYVKWISRLAEIDPRIIWALRSVRDGSLSYTRHYAASPDLVEFAEGLGYPATWGDLSVVPAYGTDATLIWRKLGVEGRDGIGGIPCELVHGGNGAGSSCGKNISIRGQKAWLAATLIYLPVHLLPVLVKRPRDLISPERLIPLLLGVMRSATFLSTFVQLMWLGVCSTRTFLVARLFPWISHDYFDGPYGCIFVASLMCGSSIWIENPRRRGEVALYVLPRAIRTVLSDAWLRGGRRGVRFIERIVFVASLSTLLTFGTHKPESLRGLSRWAVNYVLRGPRSLKK